MRKVYLDNAATTQMHSEVIEEMVNAMKQYYGNPSSSHIFGREAKALVETSRKKIAKILDVNTSEIFFTSTGTEANNLIIRSCVENLGVTRIITSPIEHKCVQETVKSVEEYRKVKVELVGILEDGSIDYKDFERLLTSDNQKTLVTLMHANNEIGNLLDLKRTASLCQEYNALFHSDTVQTMGHYTINLKELGVDFASCSAHKLHGPKGVGFVYIRKALNIKAIITGGGQERNMRSGTENIYGILGLAKSFEMAYGDLEAHQKYVSGLKEYTINQLRKEIPEIEFNGLSADLDKSLYTILSVKLPFHDELIGFELELGGVAVSQGSACSSGAAVTSSVMAVLYNGEELKQMTPLRVSFSIYNTREDIDLLVSTLKQLSNKYLKEVVNEK